MASGGYRVGSGRKKGEPTVVMRVPEALSAHIAKLIGNYKLCPAEYLKMISMTPEEYFKSLPSLRTSFGVDRKIGKKKKKRK
ncbi:hypothetical protein [Aliivibrio fischeri]|uniref:hypothetical protein n=1 Tax=Aliivibrio fischeri TaxID=668 RepID=UPI0007C4C3D6|nr:hypothetical protein [Aliivibrio fischeri]